jgi:hypothetical protein
MDSDPDETVLDLRTELYELLNDLKELKFSGVDDFARWMESWKPCVEHPPRVRFMHHGGRKTACVT